MKLDISVILLKLFITSLNNLSHIPPDLKWILLYSDVFLTSWSLLPSINKHTGELVKLMKLSWVLLCLSDSRLFQIWSHVCMTLHRHGSRQLLTKCRESKVSSDFYLNPSLTVAFPYRRQIPDEQVGWHHTRAPTCISSSSCAPCPPSWPPLLSCRHPARPPPSYLQHAQTKRTKTTTTKKRQTE